VAFSLENRSVEDMYKELPLIVVEANQDSQQSHLEEN
jgi:hypothetical protein